MELNPIALSGAAACAFVAVRATLWLPRLSAMPAVVRGLGWPLMVASAFVTHFTTLDVHPLIRMLAFIAVTLLWMKALVLAEHRIRGGKKLSWGAWMAFTFFWVGMNPTAFERRTARRRVAHRLAVRGLAWSLVGVAMVVVARWVWSQTHTQWLTAVVALPGISFLLHFGGLNLVAALWSAVGYRTDRLFIAPLRSTSLTEFWGRRWNVAFRDMTSLIVYRPLAQSVNNEVALIAAFLVSGLVHEMAISAPVQRGWGMPMTYFGLHAAAMTIERAAGGDRRFRRVWGWLWAVVWIVAPLPLLFHRHFLEGVVWPLLGL